MEGSSDPGTFGQLKPICVNIMDFHANCRVSGQVTPEQVLLLQGHLKVLRSAIASLNAAAVAACFDYILLPLNEILDFDPGFKSVQADVRSIRVITFWLCVCVMCYA